MANFRDFPKNFDLILQILTFSSVILTFGVGDMRLCENPLVCEQEERDWWIQGD